MRTFFSVCIAVIFSICCLPALAQRDSVPLNTIIAKTSAVAEARPIEKVYLHMDKPHYAVGDTIWFKAYLTTGLHQPSVLSKIVYVDVISSRDSLVETLMLPVKDGMATGSLALNQPAFKQDNYRVKAYTRWMVNFDQAYFFHKTFSVGNAINKQIASSISLSRAINNNIVQVSSTISYKDAEGNPLANKRVNWVVEAGLEEIAKGKDNTDKNGALTISFANTKGADLTSAVLTTTIEGANHKEYSQVYPLKSMAAPADLQLFPEGGNLIANVRTRVAVKAIQPNGLGIDFTGTVVDNTGAEVAVCTSQHLGMGLFAITPLTGKTYKLNVQFKDGSKGTYDLPRIQLSGFNLSVNNTDTSTIGIKLSADSAYLKKYFNQTYYVIGKSGQVICYAAQTKLNNTVYSANIPSNKFPTGIAQITLLNSSGQPISERLVFIRHNDQMNVSMASDKPSYGRRQKVRINFAAKNGVAAAAADLSLSVIDESKVSVDENAETTILTNLLLASDLRGYIEKPGYYFTQVNDKVTADLDVLMMTQGYRRFTYQEILNNRIPNLVYLPEQGIDISGTLRMQDGMPVKGGGVMLQIPDKYYTTRTTTDNEGRFKFGNLAFPDSAKVIVSAKSNYNSKSMMLMMDGSGFPAVIKNPDYADEKLNIDTVMTAYLQNSKKVYENSRMLKEVVIKAKPNTKPIATHMDYPALTGLGSIADRVITGDRLTGCANAALCLQTALSGVTYDNYNFYVTRDYNNGNRTPMAIFVKGMPVDYNYLTSIKGSDIESVEIFLKDDLGLVNRSYQSNGVLVINAKEAPKGSKISMQELQDLLPQPSVAKMSPKGYNIAKQFYSPKYAAPNSTFGPDLRSTIYWNPHIVTDATGKTFVEFYSADAKGTYRAVVEGLDKDGHLARSVYRFKVL